MCYLVGACSISTNNIICGCFTNIHCHSAFFKFKLAQALKEENTINNVLETSEIDQKGFSVDKGDTSLKSNLLPSPRTGSRCCGRAGIFFVREYKDLISSPEDRNNQV